MSTNTVSADCAFMADLLKVKPLRVTASYPSDALEVVRQAGRDEQAALRRSGRSELTGCFPSLVFRKLPAVMHSNHAMTVSFESLFLWPGAHHNL